MSVKMVIIRIRTSFWYLPALYGIIALILAIGSMFFDRYLANHSLYLYIPEVFLSDRSLAQTILSSLSASLLTMTTITFSSILVVLTTYLTQFSPRALQNFITDHHTQRVLGIFIGGFIYTIILLLILRKNDTGTLFIVPAFAIFVSIICLGMFVFFIHHVTSWIKVSNLIYNITTNTIHAISNLYIDETDYRAASPWEDWEYIELRTVIPFQLKSKKAGYVKYIEIDKMVTRATMDNCIIKIEQGLGKYVDETTTLLSFWNLDDPSKSRNYLSLITITNEQEPVEDIEFGLQKVTEIALKAVSPAINDPYTAINCINHLANILSLLGQKHLEIPFYHDKNQYLRVIFEKPLFEDYLYECFYQIRHYAKEDVSVMASILKALTFISQNNSDYIKDVIWEFSFYIVEGLKEVNWLSKDKQFLNKHLVEIAKVCNKQRREKELLLDMKEKGI